MENSSQFQEQPKEKQSAPDHVVAIAQSSSPKSESCAAEEPESWREAETAIYQILDELKDEFKANGEGECVIYRNLFLLKDIKREDDKPPEIDLLFRTRQAIFVIESKDWYGFVDGNADIPKWTRTTKQGKEDLLDNPVTQNAKHCVILRESLKEHPLTRDISLRLPIISVICFSDNSRLAEISVLPECAFITQTKNLKALLLGLIQVLKATYNYSLENSDIEHEKIDTFLAAMWENSEQWKRGKLKLEQKDFICSKCTKSQYVLKVNHSSQPWTPFFLCPNCKNTESIS